MIDKGLIRLLGDSKKYIAYTVAYMVLGLLATIGQTAGLCLALYLVLIQAELVYFLVPASLFVFCMGIRYLTSRMAMDTKDKLGRNVKKDLRHKTYQKMVQLGTRQSDMAGLVQIAMEGIEQLDLYYSLYLPQGAYCLIAPIILFVICVWIDWRVALVLLCCVPLIPISIIAVSKYAKKIFAKYWNKYTSMGDTFLDSVQGLVELKIFKADERQHQKMNKNAEQFRKITMKVLVMQLASTTIMDLVAYGGASLGIATAVYSVVARGLSPILALFLILVAVEFFLPLRAFGAAFHVAMNGVSAGQKIIQLLETPNPEWGTEIPDDSKLTLQNITFAYDNRGTILKNITMTFPQKGMTAIVGESGCGKSTIVRLLCGTHKPQDGIILVGTKPLDTLSREHYYDILSVTSVGTYLFNTTIRHNFELSRPNVTDEEIWNALEKVSLAEFIHENGGLDKIITEDSSNLSGGQKQRLALAINLISDKEIYIFDEATSNIDIESEAIIMKNIKTLSQSKSVIVISHRLENIVPADHIYYMEKGTVMESGTHQSLMKQQGHYARLYHTQKSLETVKHHKGEIA